MIGQCKARANASTVVLQEGCCKVLVGVHEGGPLGGRGVLPRILVSPNAQALPHLSLGWDSDNFQFMFYKTPGWWKQMAKAERSVCPAVCVSLSFSSSIPFLTESQFLHYRKAMGACLSPCLASSLQNAPVTAAT